MQKTNIPHVVKNIELLVSKNVLIITPEKYLAVISESLWKSFDNAEKQTTVLRNLSLYCQLKNAYTGSKVENQSLKLCIKNSLDKVISIFELKNDKVEKIDL